MQLKRCTNLLIFFSFFLSLNFWSQTATQDFNFVNIREGISKVGIYSMTQDHHGFMWICTNGSGLYKFDGINYTSYKFKVEDPNSLRSNLVFSSFLDKKNQLWIGTEAGLNLYNRDLDQFEKIPIGESDEIGISVLSIKEDDRGNLLIGTRGAGLFLLNLKTRKVIRVIDRVRYAAINAIEICNKTVFLGTSVGLRVLDYSNNKIRKPHNSSGANFNLPIQTLKRSANKDLWAGTYGNGIVKYQLEDDTITQFSNFEISSKRILAIIQLPDHSILIGSENDGLFHLNSNGELIKRYVYHKRDENSILSNSIWSLFLDKEERIWLGYYNSGVAVSDKLYDKFGNIESLTSNVNSLQTGSVTGIVKDGNNKLWVSMDGGGIDVIDAKSLKFSHINLSNSESYSGLTSNYIQTVFIDSKENVWAGSWDNGLYVLKKGQNNFENINVENSKGILISNAILTITEDQDGIIWIGSFYSGIYAYNPETKVLKNYNSGAFENIATTDVRKILVDNDNVIWFGTTAGLFKITKDKNGQVKLTSLEDQMSQALNNQKSANHILSLYQCSNQYIWIGTRGAGLCRYNKKTNKFKWYNKTTGLLEENITGIIEDNAGDIWLTGNSGISKLNIDTNKVTSFSSNDGLLSDDFNFNATLKDEKGVLYFGNYKGIDYINPKKIEVNSIVPSLYITGLKIFNKDVVPNQDNSPLTKVITETKSLEFNYQQTVFTIEYTGINYTRPEKNQYAYYLEGFEKSWNYVGNLQSATYTNLDYGEYTFKLKAANNDGVWNETPLTLKITVLPPWWKTNVAMVCYILLFFMGLYLLNKMTKSRIKERETIKNERIQRVQEDQLNERKIQFFTNISHEFRTPLTLIINPLQDILRDKTLSLPFTVKDKLDIIYRNTDRLYRMINELMDFRKLELDKVNIRASEFNLVSLTKDVVAYFKEEASNRNIYLSMDSDVPHLPVWADVSMLEKIIFNILSNAIKVTPDGGAINADILSTDDLVLFPLVDEKNPCKALEIRISDTGPGIEKDQISRIFERFYQIETLNKGYYGSTGIGLEVVQSFIKLHKGKVEVESEVGKGTIFRILLPAGNEHFTKEQLAPQVISETAKKEKFILNSALEPSEVDSSQANGNISSTLLIVEDSVELRKYLKSELKNHYKILVASNGKEGLEIAKKTIPDIILTDVIMPEMDGFEFCKQIKTDIKTSHIPLLMLTAKTRIDDRMEGIGYGADAYMVKPFDMRLLKLRLAQLITSRKLIFDKYFGDISGKEQAGTTSIDKEFIQKVLSYISENMSDSDLSVEVLASQLNLSRSQLYRKIKSLTGQTVNEFLRKIRIQKAKQILETGNSNISEVCYKIGFSSPSYFTKCFKAQFGILPTEVKVKDEEF
ncbi:two-component regulator propeller domain-containing protein [Mariniflexile sp. AS56]|uniref:two-component regulator propeller domain-containing protein n=1 Tax=Mariniflexile sp. AS56 TaxID=3063957 RepID=UPI0026EFC5B9|nr:two-component regulator propeller domain-containing protein [Mariniflexile sp. AS56]MDO7173749.1 two-component regulator propeller domain-containing protein [Mariniflexile sp. AS56]